jgi:hypothetical protein
MHKVFFIMDLDFQTVPIINMGTPSAYVGEDPILIYPRAAASTLRRGDAGSF